MISGNAEQSALVDLNHEIDRCRENWGVSKTPAYRVGATGASCHTTPQQYIEKQAPYASIPYMIPYCRYDYVTYDTYDSHLYYNNLGCHALPQLPPDHLPRRLSPNWFDRLASADARPRCQSQRAKHLSRPITAIGLTLPRGTQIEEID